MPISIDRSGKPHIDRGMRTRATIRPQGLVGPPGPSGGPIPVGGTAGDYPTPLVGGGHGWEDPAGRFAAVFTAEAEGATGDGSDDGDAIRAALANAAAATAFSLGGGMVKLRARRYGYSGTLAIPSGVTLAGEGQRLWTTGADAAERESGTLLTPLTAGSVVSIEGVSGSISTHVESVQIHDLTIDGATTTTLGIKIWNALDVTLHNVFIRACVTALSVGTTTATDYVENLRLRDVKLTNGAVGIDTGGSASKAFIDSSGLHVRNMTQAAVRGAYSGVFTGGFVGRIGTAGASDGKAFDFIDADGVTLVGIPVENSSYGVVSAGNGYGVNVLGCIFSASSPDFGLVAGVDLLDVDGWSVVGSRFLFNNGSANAIGINASTVARYGYVAGNQYQGVTGAQKKVVIGNPSTNAVNVEGRWVRFDSDNAFIGDGTGAPFVGIGGGAGNARTLTYYTGQAGVTTNQRWGLRAGPGAETGGDAGSDFEIVSYSDTGAGTTIRARVRRSDGRFTVFSPFQNATYTTAGRPSAAAAGVGAQVFDTTLNKPIWSTGSAWVDSAGTAV